MRAAFLFTWFFPGALVAQSLLFDHITAGDGLPGNEVFTAYEDRKGFMWVGTRTGLARLEGTRMRVFHHDRNDSSSLAHDQVNDMDEDAAGRLWIGTMAGLSRFDPVTGVFHNYRVRTLDGEAYLANRILQLRCVGDSLIWVVSEGGLFRFEPQGRLFRRVDGAAPGKGPPGRPSARMALREHGGNGGFWCATDKGMALWDARTDRWTDHRNATGSAFGFTDHGCITPMTHGDTLWWCENKGYRLVACNLRTGEIIHRDSVDGARNHFTLQWQDVDPSGRHWLSTWTHRLLFREGGVQWTEVTPSEDAAGLLSGNVKASLLRRNGERWFATDRGVAILRPGSEAMRRYRLEDAHGGVSCALAFGDTIVAGTARGGVIMLDTRTGTQHRSFFPLPPRPGEEVYWGNAINDLTRRDAHSCWVSSVGMPFVLDLRTGGALDFPEILSRSFPKEVTHNIRFMLPQGDSALWIGTWNDGLHRLDLRTGQRTLTAPAGGPYGPVASDMMLCMAADRKGRLWLGMNDGGGLACLDGEHFTAVEDGSGQPVGNVVRCIAEAPDGTIWLGTHEEGLLVYDPATRVTRYLTRRQGLPGVRVLQILFDGEGNAWVCTDDGLAAMRRGSNGFRVFDLPTVSPSNLVTAMAELHDGRLAFATSTNVVVYDPAHAHHDERPPEAHFTAWTVNGHVYADSLPPAALELRDDRKALSIELGVTGPYTTTRPLFRYRRSAGAPWVELGASQRLDLFDLPVGEHIIELQASSNGVEWSVTPAIMHIAVAPMFYATWWFRGALLAIVIALLFVGFRLYVQQRLRVQREALTREQAVLQERVRIAGDMHDDLGAGLSALKLRSEMALRVEKDPAKREQLASQARTAGELIASMRQIIWTMNADQAGVEDLVSYTTSYARTYCQQNHLIPEINALAEWPEVRLTSEQRRNIFLVVKEALHNVVKHANAQNVRLTLGWEGGLVVELQDDGVGLSPHAQQGEGHGLRNMGKRVAAVGGSITMETGPKRTGDLAGARIRFHVPLEANQGYVARATAPADLRSP